MVVCVVRGRFFVLGDFGLLLRMERSRILSLRIRVQLELRNIRYQMTAMEAGPNQARFGYSWTVAARNSEKGTLDSSSFVAADSLLRRLWEEFRWWTSSSSPQSRIRVVICGRFGIERGEGKSTGVLKKVIPFPQPLVRPKKGTREVGRYR